VQRGFPLQVVILAGGKGARLGELTRRLPKPMLAVAGRPFLEHVLVRLRDSGITEVVLCVSYLAEEIVRCFGSGESLGLQIQYSIEERSAGTGGALRCAQPQLRDDFYVLNGDTFFAIRMEKLQKQLDSHPDALAALALRRSSNVGQYGQVRLAGEVVTGFAEKSGVDEGLMNGGVYCMRKATLELLPCGMSSLEKDLFPRLAADRHLLGCVFDGYFIDIGLSETLQEANRDFQARFHDSDATSQVTLVAFSGQ